MHDDERTARLAFSFAWDKAQESLWPFGLFIALWIGAYGLLALVIFFFANKPLVGSVSRVIAFLGLVVFVVWFSSIVLDIAQGKRVGTRAMLRAFLHLIDVNMAVWAAACMVLLGLLSLPAFIVTAAATSLPFVAPVFSAMLAVVSWMYVMGVIALHAGFGFVLLRKSSETLRLPDSFSWSAIGHVVKTSLKILSESRVMAEKNKGELIKLWLYGFGIFLVGLVPSVATLGVGFVFLVLWFGIALARLYVGPHQVSVPVWQA